MHQQVVKGLLKINVIMKALRGELSGLGSEWQQEAVKEGVGGYCRHYAPPTEPPF